MMPGFGASTSARRCAPTRRARHADPDAHARRGARSMSRKGAALGRRRLRDQAVLDARTDGRRCGSLLGVKATAAHAAPRRRRRAALAVWLALGGVLLRLPLGRARARRRAMRPGAARSASHGLLLVLWWLIAAAWAAWAPTGLRAHCRRAGAARGCDAVRWWPPRRTDLAAEGSAALARPAGAINGLAAQPAACAATWPAVRPAAASSRSATGSPR